MGKCARILTICVNNMHTVARPANKMRIISKRWKADTDWNKLEERRERKNIIKLAKQTIKELMKNPKNKNKQNRRETF